LGALGSVRGLVHFMIERYAEFYEGYPQIVATGGDAPLLFEKDELVEHIVPDLQLVGILEVARAVENAEQEEQA
jgi:type III pantothenate kinase